MPLIVEHTDYERCRRCGHYIFKNEEKYLVVKKYHKEQFFCSLLCFLMSKETRYYANYLRILRTFIRSKKGKSMKQYPYLSKLYSSFFVKKIERERENHN